MKNIVLYLLFIMSIVALFGFAFSMAQEKIPAGQKIFSESKCSACYSFESAGIMSGKKDVVDLAKTADNCKSDYVIKYLNKEVKTNDKLHKTVFKVSAEDPNTTASRLTSLKSSK